jgi:predicted metalloprotease with PDZ domain
LIDTDQPEIKTVKHRGGETIRLEYELIQDWTGAPEAGGASAKAGGGYRPILQPRFFHFLGSGAWVLPDLPKDSKLKVSMDWKNVKGNFTLANSFGTNQTAQSFTTDVETFGSSIYVGGDYRIARKNVKGKQLLLATRGKWNFTDEEFAGLVEKIVLATREFWNDFEQPYFLVTLLPIESDPQSKSIGGTGLINSFATFVTTNATLNDVAWLIAHEYFHNWNPMAFGGMKQPEQAVYWFSEGFTDFYAYRLLLRAGLIDLEGYAARYNEFLSDYYLSPVLNENNGRIVRDFFSDQAVGKLPYRRGMLLATKWDEIIRRQSNDAKSLDDAMRQIFRQARQKKIKEISTDYVVSVLSQYARHNFAKDVEKYVEKGDTIGDFNGVLGECVESFAAHSGRFELGFDFETARKSKTVAQLVEPSAAYRAGLRNGQKVLGASVYFGITNKPVELTIEENGQNRKIVYLPETVEKISIPQFKVKKNLSSDVKNRCLNAL